MATEHVAAPLPAPRTEPHADRRPAPRAALVPLWRDPMLGLVLLLSLFAVAPFALPGYFWGANDARHHVYFLHQFNRMWEAGVWWPRWSPDFAFGYGYPFFNIYGPLSHLLAQALLWWGGLSYTAAIETIFALSIVASATAMYVCARELGGRGMGLVAALVYTFLPYHLLNLYVRANLAESMAFIWLPLCLWSVRRSVITPHLRWIVAAALAYGGLMLTSNLVIVLFTPALAAYLLLLAWLYALPAGSTATLLQRAGAALRRALVAGLGPLAGLGLSAFFWLPAFLERKFVLQEQWYGGRYDFRGHFVYPHQLFSSNWGFGVSLPGPEDPISLQIGLAALLLALIGLVRVWPRAGRQRAEFGFFALAATVAVFLTLTWAAPLWELPLIGGILQSAQFPWRWFSVMAPFVALTAGLVAWQPGALEADGAQHAADAQPAAHAQPDLRLGLVALATVILLASYPYLRVEISEPAEGPVSLAALMRFQQSSDEMTGSTAWVTEVPRWSPMADYYIQQEAAGAPDAPVSTNLDYSVFDYESFGAESVAHSAVSEEVYFANRDTLERTLVFNRFYYPGWRAFLLDGEHGAVLRELPIVPETTGTLGRITVAVPPGEGYLLLSYGDTATRRIGRWISLATTLALGAALLLVAALPASRLLARRRR